MNSTNNNTMKNQESYPPITRVNTQLQEKQNSSIQEVNRAASDNFLSCSTTTPSLERGLRDAARCPTFFPCDNAANHFHYIHDMQDWFTKVAVSSTARDEMVLRTLESVIDLLDEDLLFDKKASY